MIFGKKNKLDVTKPVRNKETGEEYLTVVIDGKIAWVTIMDKGIKRMLTVPPAMLENYVKVPKVYEIPCKLIKKANAQYEVTSGPVPKDADVVSIKTVEFELP